MEEWKSFDNKNEREEIERSLDPLEKAESEDMKQIKHPSTSLSAFTVLDTEDGVHDETPADSLPEDKPTLHNEGVDTKYRDDPDYIEERFRVDRRKLEQLIQVSEDEEENAEVFFTKIMQETNTHIAWPSKLKIGAKSKKDPHIKVSGHKDAVSEAKNQILAILDTRSLRVTLKMDVSHTEHSHVIGKSGHNIKRVMQETGCHIHFPDSNRNNQAEKSNQVSLAGQCDGVELARTRIRELLPLIFMFEVPINGPNQPNLDANSSVIQNIQQHFGINISIKPHHQTFTRTVIIRGSVFNSKSIQNAATTVFELLTGRSGVSFGVSMVLDIAPQHHLFIIGHGRGNINRIMQQTGATVHFPDPSITNPQRRGTVYISGTMNSAFLARQELLGCLPLVLMFDLKEHVDVDPGLLSQLMEQLDVFISIKPKPKQNSKSVIVKTIESNSRNVYEARRKILGLRQQSSDTVLVSAFQQDSLTHGVIDENSGFIVNACNDNDALRMDQKSTSNPSSSVVCSTNQSVYQPFVMLHPQHQRPSFQFATPFPPLPPMPCYVPNPEWPNYSMGRQHSVHMGSSPPLQGIIGNDDVLNQMTSAFSLQNAPEMPSNAFIQPSLDHVSRHNIRNTEILPSSSLDLFGSDLVSKFPNSSSLVCGPHSHHRGIDSLANIFDVSKSNLITEETLQQAFLRNHLGTTTAATALLPTSSSDPGMSGQIPFSQFYPVESGNVSCSYHHHHHQPSSLSPALSHHHHHTPQQQQLYHHHQHDGIYETMPDIKNYVYQRCTQKIDVNDAYHNAKPSSAANNDIVSIIYSREGGPKVNDREERHDLLEDVNLHHVQNGEIGRGDGGECDSDTSSEHGSSKAPGNNRPKKSSNASSSPQQFEAGNLLLNDVDYEQMKELASKAMQKKPIGESRIPTDLWSGLGFSRSMPASAIRDKLNQNDLSYKKSDMTTPYEVPDEDGDDVGVWPDHQLSNHRNQLSNHGNQMNSASEDLLNLVSQLSAQCGLQDDRSRDFVIMDGHPLVNKTSSIWHHPANQKSTDCDRDRDSDLSQLFKEMGLSKYVDLFQQQEIDMATFLTLTDQDLKDLGISTFGARRKMLLAIADLNKRQAVLPPPPGLPNPFRDAGIIHRHDIVSQSVRW